MESVEVTKDLEGNITGIKVTVKDNPGLAQEVYKLMRTLENVKNIRRSTVNRAVSKEVEPTETLTPHSFVQLIEEAKASGEVSREEFFLHHPAWRREKSYSQS